LVLGFPVAYHLTRTRSRYKGLLFSCVLSPLLVGVVIRSYGWMILLADHGLINESLLKAGIIKHSLPLMYNYFGVMTALVHVFLPFMVLSLSGSIQTINPDLESMAQSLGASRLRAFFDVVLPLSLPGVLSGSILVFVMTVSSYVLPILVGGFRVIITPMLVVQQVIEIFNWPGGAALALILFVASLLVIVSFMKFMNHAMRGIA
jgi:putative spermidine/putrescine transport system permease protein